MKIDREQTALTELTEGEVLAEKLTDDEKIDAVAHSIMERFKPAFLELAK